MAIVLLLRSRKRVSAQTLADMFEMHIRTIYSDVQALCEAGVPILSLPGADGGYELMSEYFIPPVIFSLDVAVALFLGGNFIAQRKGTPFSQTITTALVKLEAILPEETRRSVALTTESITFSVSESDDAIDMKEAFAVLTQAI